jgi:hypothetical protein
MQFACPAQKQAGVSYKFHVIFAVGRAAVISIGGVSEGIFDLLEPIP